MKDIIAGEIMEKIIEVILGLFGGITNSNFGKEILVFIISMLPLLESRGGILAAALLDMDPMFSYIICMIGNIVVIPIALYLLEIIFKILRKIKFFEKIIVKIENKCLSKRAQLDKYGYWGLVLFVGIPIPGTGAWTGCFLASLLGMDKKKCTLAAMLGVVMASILMMILSFGIIKSII